jgi:arylsulfatase
MHGRSIRATFTDADAPAPRHVQYFEQMGHRGIWADGWKATTYHESGAPFDDDEWALFHLDQDFSECHDLAAEQPQKLRELIDLWWTEAGDKGVLPLDDRTIELFGGAPRPGTVHARPSYVYVPPLSHIPADASPQLGARAWTVSADVTVEHGAEGVLYARGSHNVGHSFFVRAGELHFDYNALGTHSRASAPLALVPGRHALAARFDRDGASGRLTICVDGADVASVGIPRIVRMLGSTGTDIGCDRLSAVVDDYEGPFPFTGTIHSVTFDIRSKRDASDIRATAAAELSRE